MRAAVTVCLALALSACGPSRPAVVTHAPGDVRGRGDYLPEIRDAASWRDLAAAPGRQVAAHTEVVKVVIDLADDWRVYFLQSRRWEIHYFFAARFLSSFERPVEDHAAFNVRQYRRDDRRFVLGTLTRYEDQDVWAFELVAGDTLDLDRTARAFRAVRARVHFGDALRYHPVPPHHDAARDALTALGVPLVTTEALVGATRYQPVNPGEAVGWLRFFEGDPDPARVRRTDVVVLDGVPLDLPVCAGVVTSELQSPLGHLGVLATNRRTPDMALRGAFRDPRLRALEGQLVRLRVTPQDWSVEPATQAEADRAWASMRPRDAMRPPLGAPRTELVDVRALGADDVGTAGAKAAQLGELASIGAPVEVPRGFVVPFAWYLAHLRQCGAERMLAEALARPDVRDDVTARAAALEAVRARIAAAPVDPSLLAALRARAAPFAGRRLRFRSSTNAEDLPGFNGAGLYRSVITPADAPDAALADALRAVWASTWSLQAHEERAFFRVDEARVAMAVLVQESIDDDVVDGVAVTANPFNAGRPAVFMNAQVAGAEGGAVTSARGDEVPEQVLYYTYGEEREFERLSRSTRTRGAPVLSDDEVHAVATALRRVHAHFNRAGGEETAMDVEFLLAGAARRLVFVQARPYPLRHDWGRGMAPERGE